MSFGLASLVDREHPSRSLYGWLMFILVLTATPVVSNVAAAAIADVLGCRFAEVDPTPCLVRGADLTGLLAAMVASGTLRLVTIPLGALLLLGWFVAVLTLLGKSPHGEQPTQAI